MYPSSERTDPLRQHLLSAGRSLLDAEDGGNFDPDSVCAAAGAPPESLARLFGDWDAYRCALLAVMIDEVRERVARITSNMPFHIVQVGIVDTRAAAILGGVLIKRLTG